MRTTTLRRLAAAVRRPGAAILLEALAGGWLVVSGAAADTAATLVVMGFSPDRASLLTGLLVEALLVTLGTLAFATPRAAGLAGIVAFAIWYSGTLAVETTTALQASGPLGTFDPLGWGLTILTLAVAALAVAWAAAVLSGVGRRRLVIAAADVARIARGDRSSARLRGPLAVGAVLVLLAVTGPVFGDMVNYEPDVHMRQGAAVGPNLTDTGPAASLPPIAADGGVPGSVVANGGIVAPGSSPGAVVSSARPWLAWRPTGFGTVQRLSVAAPWQGLPATTTLAVYLPPGYATSDRRYPVVYEVPFSYTTWQTSAQIENQMDNLIDSGAVPPELVVFVPERGGPYPDSECANSVDGREWFDSWMLNTVVPLIDSTYRTVGTAAARTVMGFSQGGFCASMFVLRHPDVFENGIAFSGYYQAGVRSGQTPNAWLPYGGIASVEAAASPILLAAAIPPAQRASLFLELSVEFSEPFYGPQARAFIAVLHSAGIPFDVMPTPLGHAWAAVRTQLGTALETLAARQVADGVFAA